MNPNDTSSRVLTALFELARDVEPIDIITVAKRASVSVYSALKALDALGEQGLVRPRQLRLTFLGLAAASALVGLRRRRDDSEDEGCDAWEAHVASVRARRPRAA